MSISLGSKISNYAIGKVAKHVGKAIKTTKNIGGTPVVKNLKTGTEVMRFNGVKSVNLGSGNKLNSQYGIQGFVSYPAGMYGSGRQIVVNHGNGNFVTLSPQELGQYIKDWKAFVLALKQMQPNKIQTLVNNFTGWLR